MRFNGSSLWRSRGAGDRSRPGHFITASLVFIKGEAVVRTVFQKDRSFEVQKGSGLGEIGNSLDFGVRLGSGPGPATDSLCDLKQVLEPL